MNKEELKKNYENACNAYLRAFCEKHDFYFEDAFWAGDDVGGIADIGGNMDFDMATIRTDICDAFLEARKHITLSPRQAIIADQCEILMRAFARVGIITLVDAATGYAEEKNRAKDELQKFFNQFLRQEAAKWVKTFNDQFFEDIYKMRGWTWQDTSKRPGVIGTWIRDIAYERIAPIMEELEKLNPKNANGIVLKSFISFSAETRDFQD